jgi:hypothetical protein
MSDTLYGTDTEKLDDANKRIQRIMKLRGVSGYFVISLGDKSREHIAFHGKTFLDADLDNESIAFQTNMDPRAVSPDQGVNTIRELSEIANSAHKISLGIQKFAKHFEKIMKDKLNR